MRQILLLILFCPCIHSATTVWLRGTPPPVTKIVSPGCTNATPMVCAVASVAGLAQGDTINVMGVCATDGVNNISAANGIRKIGAISGSTVSLQDNTGTPGVADGVSVAGNGAWCTGESFDPISPYPAAQQSIAKLTSYTRVTGISGWLDGDNGPTTRKWALGTQNGLTSLIVTGGNLATVTTSYVNGMTTGDKISVWGTTNSTLSAATTGSEFTVTVTSPTTFTFPVSISNGDYTHNDHCGPAASPNSTIGGTDNCVRLSQLAVSTSWAYVQARGKYAELAGNVYQWGFSGAGGTYFGPDGDSQSASDYALWFLIDQSNSTLLAACLYYLNNLELMAGGNFFANSTMGDGGVYDLSAQVSQQNADFMRVYMIASPYMPATGTGGRKNARDKLLNNITDPGGCTKHYPSPIALNSGTTTGGTSTTITLAAGASASTNFYVNNVIEVASDPLNPLNHLLGTVTAYNGSTKVATVGSWNVFNPGTGHFDSASGTNPANGNTYNVWESSSLSTTTNGASVTITGYNTHWNTAGADQIHVGDYILSWQGWRNYGFVNPGQIGIYITAVTDDTHLTGINGGNEFGLTTPQPTWIIPHWVPGDCGEAWLQEHWVGVPGSQPVSFPIRGGGDSLNADGSIRVGSNIQGNLANYALDEYILCAGEDVRCVTNAAKYSVAAVDENLAFDMSYITGFVSSGVNYGPGRGSDGPHGIALVLYNSVVGYPNQDLSGAWIQGHQYWKMYALWPDSPFNSNALYHQKIMAYYGDSAANSLFGRGEGKSYSMILDLGIIVCPTCTSSKYVNYFQQNVLGYNSSGASSSALTEISLKIDPRNPMQDYTSLPTQYLFQATSRTAAVAISGWNNPATWRGDAFISRTGWTSPSDTHVQFQARSYYLDHDYPQPGVLWIHKAGELLSNESIPPGDGFFAVGQPTLEFGGAISFRVGIGNSGGVAVASMIRWSGTAPFGDPSSKYVCGQADVAGSYNPSPTRATRWVCHLKKPASEEIIVTYTDVATSSPTIIRDQLFYPQNGETTAGGGFQDRVIYPEGDTICPGSGGCASLNTNRTVLEQEDGLSSNGDPLRQYNLISKFFSPGTITLHWDGVSYSGATGHAYRASIYGGSSVGGTSTSLESVAVHKVATQPDTTLTAVALNPDANWTGVQTADKVVLFARGGVTHSAITGFNTTHSGTAQYLIAGLTAGSYDVYNGATRVISGAVVVAGDNSLEFEHTSGSYTLIAAGSVTITTTSPLANGLAGSSYTQNLAELGGTAPFTWSIASGSIPAGLSLNSSTGTITGTPTAGVTSNFTIHVADSLGAGDSKAFTIVIYGIIAISNNSPLPAGITNVPYNQVLSATGGDGNYTWSLVVGALPAGLTLSSGGVISGTPTTGETQTPTFHVLSGDGQSVNKQLSITIVVPVSVTTSSPLPTGRVGLAYSQALSASGGTSPYTWSVISGSLPGGLSLSSSGTINGIPAASGNFNFTAQAMDTLGATGNRQFSLTINGILNIASTSPLPPAMVGASYSQVLTAVGGDGNYTWSLLSGALPAGLALASNGVITGTPALPGIGTATIQISSGDSQTDSRAFSITVTVPPAAVKIGGAVNAGAVVH